VAGGAVARLAHAPILVLGRRLQLREAVEAERLGEADDRRARGVRPARELLRGVEGGLVEVVDDVLADVLLRARELVEALADLLRQRQRLGAAASHRRQIRPPPGSSSRGGPGPTAAASAGAAARALR
jgi:hypothetical protein